MRIYLAGGYSIMNVKGRERELLSKFKYSRLLSFADHSLTPNKMEDSLRDIIAYLKGRK